MAKLDLTALIPLLSEGVSFELTEKQYEEKIKKPLPKTYYLKTRSPIAKVAKNYGYIIQVEERVHRVLVFSKAEDLQKQGEK